MFFTLNIQNELDVYMLCVLNAAPFESMCWRFTTNHVNGFSDEMCMRITFDMHVA